MEKCKLPEFICLLRLGLWGGGEVAGIGYVSTARSVGRTGSLAAMTEFGLGCRIMMECGRSGVNGGAEMTFSVYNPYSGEYDFFAVTAERDDNMKELLHTMVKEVERESLLGPRLPREYVSLHSKRRYVAGYSSMRSGKIAVTKRNR
jgi:hypothetical protein